MVVTAKLTYLKMSSEVYPRFVEVTGVETSAGALAFFSYFDI
jgi:hypothetical protein